MTPHRWLPLLVAVLAGSCASADSERGADESVSLDSAGVATSTGRPSVSAAPATPEIPKPRLERPRAPFDGSIALLWQRPSADADTVLLLPSDIFFSSAGLLVFDVGDRTVRILEPSSGRFLGNVGREGRGPGEFGRVMWFLGPYRYPALFDASARRLTPFTTSAPLVASISFPERPWFLSACELDPTTTLHTASVESGRDIFLARAGAVLDSLATPWTELSALNPIVRQSIARQMDDDSCVLFTLYQSRFATYSSSEGFRTGRFIEPPTSVAAVIRVHEDGRGSTRSLPRGTVAGPSAASGWQDHVVVLFGGRSEHRHRVLDFYRRDDLQYAGSLLLPWRARTIAIRGDTLAVVGEKDDYPIVAAFLIRRSGGH